MAVVVWPRNLASLRCRDGARRDFTAQADISPTKEKARRKVFGEELHPTIRRAFLRVNETPNLLVCAWGRAVTGGGVGRTYWVLALVI